MSVGNASLELSDIFTKFCAAVREYATLSNIPAHNVIVLGFGEI